jgi:cytochrome c1
MLLVLTMVDARPESTAVNNFLEKLGAEGAEAAAHTEEGQKAVNNFLEKLGAEGAEAAAEEEAGAAVNNFFLHLKKFFFLIILLKNVFKN